MSDLPKPPFGIEGVLSLLPHRYPMLLVDKVLEIEGAERIVAIKNVSHNEPFFQGHFPGMPIMPGVLIVEAIAQAAGLLVLGDVEDRENSIFVFAGIEKARFRRPIVPGDQVRLEVEILRRRTSHIRFSGRALVDGEVAAEATCHSAMIQRQ
jgi:3-hydroxyacyl-[acyl-carrier-protein] dehydratase